MWVGIHPEGENNMAMSGLAVKIPQQQHFSYYPCVHAQQGKAMPSYLGVCVCVCVCVCVTIDSADNSVDNLKSCTTDDV